MSLQLKPLQPPLVTKIAAPTTLSDMFETLMRNNIRYVILDNYDNLPGNWNRERPVVVLVEKLELFLRLANFNRVKDWLYAPADIRGTESLQFLLREKGNGFLPPDLERRLLDSRLQKDKLLYYADPEANCLARLYQLLHHDNFHGEGRTITGSLEARKELCLFISNRCGAAVKPRYTDLTFYPAASY